MTTDLFALWLFGCVLLVVGPQKPVRAVGGGLFVATMAAGWLL